MKIFIDAGHNDKLCDTGATANGLKEQDITFAVSNILAEKFKNIDVDIKLSRPTKSTILGTDLNSSLNKRAELANKWGADLFLSIHCNSFWLASANGTEVYAYSKKSSVYNLGKKIAENISKQLDIYNRGIKTSNFAVLKKTSMPALLIELAFISNVNDAQKLKDRQEEFADAIFQEVCEYYNLKPKKQTNLAQSYNYYVEGTTHIVEIDPRNVWAVETQCKTNKVSYNNFVNSVFFMNLKSGKTHPQGIIVNAGKVTANNPTHGKPVATLIVYGKDNVQLKYIDDITKEKDVWFAISGYGIYPEITAGKEGFVGKFSDVTRSTSRPIIGYRKKDNKIVIAVRENSNAERAKLTAKNLGLDFAISLDGGGSTTLKVDGKYKFKGDGRKIFGGIIWS